jgi:hypothetical protein
MKGKKEEKKKRKEEKGRGKSEEQTAKNCRAAVLAVAAVSARLVLSLSDGGFVCCVAFWRTWVELCFLPVSLLHIPRSPSSFCGTRCVAFCWRKPWPPRMDRPKRTTTSCTKVRLASFWHSWPVCVFPPFLSFLILTPSLVCSCADRRFRRRKE